MCVNQTVDASIWSIDSNNNNVKFSNTIKTEKWLPILQTTKSICIDPSHAIDRSDENIKDNVVFLTPDGWKTGIVDYYNKPGNISIYLLLTNSSHSRKELDNQRFYCC